MSVRAIDGTGDWSFGKGKSDYRIKVNEVAQNIKTRLQSFIGDCFFASNAGVDWFNLLGQKNILQLRLNISATILNTQDVTGLIEVLTVLDEERKLTITYSVTTSYGTITNESVEI